MKNRKYNLFVLVFSLIISLFASCSNGMNLEEPNKAKISFTFEDEYFQKLFESKSNSRIINIFNTAENLIEWYTIKDYENKTVVAEGNENVYEIPFGYYDFSFEAFYLTDNESEVLNNKIETAIEENGIFDPDSTLTDEERIEKIKKIQNEILLEYVNTHTSLYFSNISKYLVGQDNIKLLLRLTKNPEFNPSETTSDFTYTFFYDSDLVKKDNNVPKVQAKLFKFSDYLEKGVVDTIPIETLGISTVNRDSTKISTVDFQNANKKYGINSEDFQNDKVYQINIARLAPDNYVLLLEFDLINSSVPYRVTEILKIDSGLYYNALYNSYSNISNITNGFIYLPKYEAKLENTAYSNQQSDGIVFSVSKSEDYNYIRLKAIPNVSSFDSFDMLVPTSSIEKYTINFFYPEIDIEYVCSAEYYKQDPYMNSFDNPDYTVDLGPVKAESSLFENKSPSRAIAEYDSDNKQIIITNFEKEYLIVSKSSYSIEDAHVNSFDIKYSQNGAFITETFEVDSFNYFNSDSNQIIISVKDENVPYLENLIESTASCFVICNYVFTYNRQYYSIPLFTDTDSVIIQNKVDNGYVTYTSTNDSNGIQFIAKKIDGAMSVNVTVYPTNNTTNKKYYSYDFDVEDEVTFYLFNPDITSTYICEYKYLNNKGDVISGSEANIENIEVKSQLYSSIKEGSSCTVSYVDSQNIKISNYNSKFYSKYLKVNNMTDEGISLSVTLTDITDDTNKYTGTAYLSSALSDLTITYLNGSQIPSTLTNKTCLLTINLNFDINGISYEEPWINSSENLQIAIAQAFPDVSIIYDSTKEAFSLSYSNPDIDKYTITSFEICGDNCSFIKTKDFDQNNDTFLYPFESSKIDAILKYKNESNESKEVRKTFSYSGGTFKEQYSQLQFNSSTTLYSSSIFKYNDGTIKVSISYNNTILQTYSAVKGNVSTYFNYYDSTDSILFKLQLLGFDGENTFSSIDIVTISDTGTSTTSVFGGKIQLNTFFTEIPSYPQYELKLLNNFILKQNDDIDFLFYLNNTCNLKGCECSVTVITSGLF